MAVSIDWRSFFWVSFSYEPYYLALLLPPEAQDASIEEDVVMDNTLYGPRILWQPGAGLNPAGPEKSKRLSWRVYCGCLYKYQYYGINLPIIAVISYSSNICQSNLGSYVGFRVSCVLWLLF